MSGQVEVAGGGAVNLRATALEEGIFRIQAGGHDGFAESLLERYGFVNPLAEAADARAEGGTISAGDLELELIDGAGFVLRSGGETLVRSLPATRVATAPTRFRNQGYLLELPVAEGEKFVGFGDQVRTQYLLNGQRDQLWIRYPVKHIPVPFFMSDRGYGVFFNTTRRLRFDVAASDPAVARFHVEKDYLDVFLIPGATYEEVIRKYCCLTGFPTLPPVKSFGLWLIMHSKATGHDVLNVALQLRRAEIPCDNISLEPDWMEKRYDYSVHKEWNADRFRGTDGGSPYRAGPSHMMQALKRMGYETGLWLCCRHDFTWEEERRLAASKEAEEAADGADLEGVEISHMDENMGHGAIRMDTFTPEGEAWFEHLKKFVDDGVRYFKVDPAVLINEFPDRLYGNGRHDDEMHNLAFLLASKQMSDDYEAHTGKRSYGISVAGWAGQQRYAGTWAGDTGGGKQPLIGILQDAVVGHTYATCDMKTDAPDGIHMGFLLPWSLINSWCYFHYPAFQGDAFDAIYRDYSQLRMRLLPFFYSLARRASQTGKAIARPLFLLHPDRDEAYEATGQFYLGDHVLVSVYQGHKITLPEGRWFDYWTGEVHEGDWTEREIAYPENRGGHLFIKEGALIPTCPVRQHVGDGTFPEVTWLAFPGPAGSETRFPLYLDAGDGLEYREGAWASAEFVMRSGEDGVEFSWGEAQGNELERLRGARFAVEVIGSGDSQPLSCAFGETVHV